MLGYTRNHLLGLLAPIVTVMTITSLLLMYFIPAPPSQFLIATGRSHQIYEGIGNQYREILARSHVDLNIRLTNGAQDNIRLLNDPASGIKAGFVQGGISTRVESPDLRSLGRINYQVYWIFTKAADTSGDLRQLKGKRVALGPEGSGQRPMTEKILAASGVNSDNTTLLGLSAPMSAKSHHEVTWTLTLTLSSSAHRSVASRWTVPVPSLSTSNNAWLTLSNIEHS